MSDTEGDCGCVFHIVHEPCDRHRETFEAGEEHACISIEFHTKYSDWPANRHNVNLERVQRLHLGLEDEPMAFNEESLADMLQSLADDEPRARAAFALTALANALRGEDDHHRLRLHQTKRGKWQSPADRLARHRQHCAWIVRLHRLQREGWQTDAAIHRIAETTGNSVARIYAGIAEERAWQDILRSFPKMHSEFAKLQRSKAVRSPDEKS